MTQNLFDVKGLDELGPWSTRSTAHVATGVGLESCETVGCRSQSVGTVTLLHVESLAFNGEPNFNTFLLFIGEVVVL